MNDPADLWRFLLPGYVLTVLIEAPVLLLALSARHSLRRRLFAGAWLTACTYPMVVLVFPALFDPVDERVSYLVVAEVFAPVAECLLFWWTFGRDAGATRRDTWQDMGAIVVANLLSFGIGEWLGVSEKVAGWFGI